MIRPLTLPDATGGDGILSYTLTPTLPAGLTLTRRTIAGTPTGIVQTTAYTWTVTDSNNASTRLMFTIAVHATSVCFRTPEIRDAIVRRVDELTPLSPEGSITCAEVTSAQLQAIDLLSSRGVTDGSSIFNLQISSLKEGDFDGLSGLLQMKLNRNRLTTLPEGIFRGLTKMNLLTMSRNQLTTLSGNVFNNLNALRYVELFNNQLTTLPEGLFDGLNLSDALLLHGNPGSPFALNVAPERQANGRFQAYIAEAAPRTVTVDWSASDGTSGTVTIPAGRRRSDDFGSARQPPLTITLSNPRLPGVTEATNDNARGSAYTGFQLTAVPARGAVIIAPTALTVAEGAMITYTVVLDTAPTGNVIVTPNAGSTGTITISATLTFSPTTWNALQTVTVTTAHDPDATPDTATIAHAVTGYGHVTAAQPVTVTVTDDDTPGVTIAPTALTVTEGARTTYTVVLDTAPTGAVTVTATIPAPLTTDTPALTFSPTTWNTTQTVTITAAHDPDATHDTATIAHAVTGYGRVAAAPTVTVTVTDDDPPGVTIAPTALTVAEGAQTTYTVVLDTAPTGTVTVTATTPAPLTTDTAALTFSPATWNALQTVTVTATHDPDATHDTATIAHAVTGYGRVAAAPTVTVTVTDDDLPGVTIAPTALTVAEGAQTTYTVVLDTAPTGAVTVTATTPVPLTTDTAALTFSPATWNTTQTVTITAAHDPDATPDTATIAHAVTGYGRVAAQPVTVTVTDDDPPGVTITPTALTVTEGAQTTYTVVLDTAPTGAVTVAATTPAPLTTDTPALTFSPTSWHTAQTVTITAAYNPDATHDPATIPHAVTGYGRVAAAPTVTVTVTDDDPPGVTVAPTALTVTEGAQTTYTVVLDTAPTGAVTVTATIPAPLTTDTPALTFSPTTWNTMQTVTITATHDPDATHDTATIPHAITGYGSIAAARDVTVTVTDDDPPGVTIAPTTLTVAEGARTTYTVVLDTAPTGAVTVTATIPAPLTTDTPALTFSPTTWNTLQTVTITAAHDPDATHDTATIPHAVTGYGRVAAAPTVTVTVTDDDPPGVTVAPTALTVAEGAQTTYTVVLDTAPTGAVTVTATIPAPLTTDTPVLTFSATTWNTMQTVTVTAAHDPDATHDTATIPHAVTGYGRVAAAPTVTVTVTDDDPPGVTIAPTALTVAEGATTTYTVVLNTAPSGNVTVTPDTGSSGTITVSAALTFSTTTWNTVQTVTISAGTDPDTTDAAATITHTVSGYDPVTIATAVPVTVTDTGPEPVVTITPTALTVDEGATITYTVVMSIAARDVVTIEPIVAATAGKAIVVSPHALTFSHGIWTLAQTVTVTALTDSDSIDGRAIIVHTVNGHRGAPATDVTVTINDAESAARRTTLNRVILPEVARALADHRVSTIAQRIRHARSTPANKVRNITIGGQSTLAGVLTTHGLAFAENTLNLKTLLGSSDFVLPLHALDAGQTPGLSGVTLWGGGDYRAFSGKDSTIEWDGDMFSAHLGADTLLHDNLLAGVAMSWSEVDLDYDFTGLRQRGDYEVNLTTVHPYVGWTALAGRLDVWATAGYGWGELEITDDDSTSRRTASDVTTQTVGAGGSTQVLKIREATLRLKVDALHTTMDVDESTGLPAVMVEARRMRLSLQASQTHTLAGWGQLSPTVEVGMRHDAGDGRTGTGAEVGGRLHYNDVARGLTLEGHGRVLLGHGGDYEDWGIGGTVRLETGQDGHGLSFSLQPTWGTTASRVAQVWAQEAALLPTSATRPRDGRIDLNLSYGLVWNESLVTPYGQLALTNSATRSYRLGSQIHLGNQLTFNLEGTRRENATQPVDHGLLLQIRWDF